jgi:hypothetical protein
MFGLTGLIKALFNHGLIELKRPAQAHRQPMEAFEQGGCKLFALRLEHSD